MSLQNTTPVPNRLFDLDLVSLKEVELKVLLTIIRKTLGWVETDNRKQRKQIAKISIAAFVMNTGCSKRGISGAIENLIHKNLIAVFDHDGKELKDSNERKGKYHLYFKATLPPVENHKKHFQASANFSLKPAQNLHYTIKEREQKKREKEFFKVNPNQAPSLSHISNYFNKYTQ